MPAKTTALNLQVLLSTMNRDNLSFLTDIFSEEDLKRVSIIVVNQTVEGHEIKEEHPNVLVINSFEKGLANSRNLALKRATAQICLIADDDVKYPAGFSLKILNAFKKYPHSGIITFQIETFEGAPYTKYPKKAVKNAGIFKILNTSSIEIAFRREKIIENHLFFNPLFGLGGTFNGSLEQVFLTDAQKKELLISYVPQVIVQHAWYSSGKDYGTQRYYEVRGALYRHIFGKLWWFWLGIQLFFNLKHGQTTLRQLVKNCNIAIAGQKRYLELTKK